MVNRLKPLNLIDFTGGVNLRPETFQLLENELPVLLNLEVDPRGGLNTRKGWKAITPIACTTQENWDPHNAYTQRFANGDQWTYVANKNSVYGLHNTVFTAALATGCTAAPHMADFASWGDLVYVARGWNSIGSFSLNGNSYTAITACAAANWQNDYTAPGASNTMPKGEVIAQHQGYLFVANTGEDGAHYPNRIRWSHPNNPVRWAQPDYIDINEGGQHITAIIPFSDRLIIFKPDSVWALFGYDAETWEVTNISRTIGCANQQLVARSEDSVFFLSWPQGIFAYTTTQVNELSVQIRTVFQDQRIDPTAIVNAFMGWVGRRLWVSLPFTGDYPLPDDSRMVFVFDPVLSSWTMFQGSDPCVPGPYIERIETDAVENQLAFSRQYPHAIALDVINAQAVDECHPGMPMPFPTRIRTRWLDAGAPTWKKSWRRPDFLLRALTVQSTVNVQVYHDFDSSNAERSFVVSYTPDNPRALWGHFVYGDGTTYGGSDQSSSVERGATMGRAGVVQLAISGFSGVAWGLNGIIFKFIPRRFR